MRFYSLLAALVLSFTTDVFAGDPVLTSDTVIFDGNELHLASSEKNANGLLREYIPPGEKLDSWTKLAAFRLYPQLDNPATAAANLLRALKKQNPGAKAAMIINPKTSDAIVDFITWPEDTSFAEFNVMKYSKFSGGGLVMQQYALRAYGDDVMPFMKNLKSLRTGLVDKMASEGIKSVK